MGQCQGSAEGDKAGSKQKGKGKPPTPAELEAMSDPLPALPATPAARGAKATPSIVKEDMYEIIHESRPGRTIATR